MVYRIILLIIISLGCFNEISEKDRLNKKNPIGVYGEALSDGPVFSVGDLLSAPEKNVGNSILINGVISEVCPMRGCWIQVEDNNSKESIRIKVADGAIVFPLSSEGKNVIAEGQFSKLVLSKSQAKNWKAHLAAEKGVALDTSKIILNENDYYEYRLYSKAAKIF
tara:strand:+ start:408 stop:905 length:498 start_codon:yes stop_codon:yes gene_type:complete